MPHILINLAKFLLTFSFSYSKKKNRSHEEQTENIYLSDFVTTQHNFSFFKKSKFMTTFNFQCLNPAQSFQGDSLLLTTKSLAVSGTLMTDLTIKPPSGFELANPGLVIDTQLIYYSFIITNQPRKHVGLEDVLKASSKTKNCYVEDVLKTCLEDVMKTYLEDVSKTLWRQRKYLLEISVSNKSK